MKYRLIMMRGKDAYTQMAVDEAILDAVLENKSPETLRFFDFCPQAITIGRLQKIEEINVNLCEKKGIDIVRRLTGGRAVVHSGDFTFSLIIKRNNPIFGGTIYETYKAVSAIFLFSLRSLDVSATWEKVKYTKVKSKNSSLQQNPLCFSSVSRYELTINKKKVLGVSQYRKRDTILIQGTLLLRKTTSIFFDLFPRSSHGSISNIEEIGKITIGFETFGDVFKEELKRTYRISVGGGELSSREIEQAEILRRKYKSYEWNYRYTY